jgi:predicted transcriptional regulator
MESYNMNARARTLRLGPDAAAALDRIVETEHTSANTAIERAIIEYDKKRVDARDAALRRLYDENRPLMDRLA